MPPRAARALGTGYQGRGSRSPPAEPPHPSPRTPGLPHWDGMGLPRPRAPSRLLWWPALTQRGPEPRPSAPTAAHGFAGLAPPGRPSEPRCPITAVCPAPGTWVLGVSGGQVRVRAAPLATSVHAAGESPCGGGGRRRREPNTPRAVGASWASRNAMAANQFYEAICPLSPAGPRRLNLITLEPCAVVGAADSCPAGPRGLQRGTASPVAPRWPRLLPSPLPSSLPTRTRARAQPLRLPWKGEPNCPHPQWSPAERNPTVAGGGGASVGSSDGGSSLALSAESEV